MNKIAIIGAGWYGCHISTTLQTLGFEVEVFERENEILTQASGNNQFRLHLGFHYARHYNTRLQSRDGYQRFIERYPTLSSEIKNNIYAVPTLDSLIDFQTYKVIMMSSGIEFTEIQNPEWAVGLSGSVRCRERVLETRRAREYFKQKLGQSLYLNCPVTSTIDRGTHVEVNGARYDFLIDCTWGHYRKNRTDVFYEPTLLLYYKTAELGFPAFTLVDGPLASIYPTEDKDIYTLSSVIHTPLKTFSTPAEAKHFIDHEVSSDILNDKIAKMEEHISKYVPSYRDRFTYLAPQFAIKTKIFGAVDDRSCSVNRSGRIISVMSGKIDTIFHGMERVLHHMETINE